MPLAPSAPPQTRLPPAAPPPPPGSSGDLYQRLQAEREARAAVANPGAAVVASSTSWVTYAIGIGIAASIALYVFGKKK